MISKKKSNKRKNSYVKKLRSRKRSKVRNQNGGFTLIGDISLIFTSIEALEKKYKNDPEKVIKMIKRRTKVRKKALIVSAIVALLTGGSVLYNNLRNDLRKLEKKKKIRRRYEEEIEAIEKEYNKKQEYNKQQIKQDEERRKEWDKKEKKRQENYYKEKHKRLRKELKEMLSRKIKIY